MDVPVLSASDRERQGVDRTPPRRGHAPVETPAGSTVALERLTGPKPGGRPPVRPDTGPARTERPRPLGEAWTTGAAQRAMALEPGCFRYAYRPGHAARRCDVTRSLENLMKTITSVAPTREGAACSLRTSRAQAERYVGVDGMRLHREVTVLFVCAKIFGKPLRCRMLENSHATSRPHPERSAWPPATFSIRQSRRSRPGAHGELRQISGTLHSNLPRRDLVHVSRSLSSRVRLSGFLRFRSLSTTAAETLSVGDSSFQRVVNLPTLMRGVSFSWLDPQ